MWTLSWTTSLLVLSLAALLGAEPATSQPSKVAVEIRAWLDQLADKDADVRARATQHLLDLRPQDLPQLRRVVADAKPLRPSQMSPLRDIVRHLYISGVEYTPEQGDRPFLGLSWNGFDEDELDPEEPGVPVIQRVPGFGAYQALRDGDRLLGIEDASGVTRFNRVQDVTTIIGACHADQEIKLWVLRQGKSITVTVKLKQKPAGLSNGFDALNHWLDDQIQAADQYWQDSFAPLLAENMS